MVREPDASAIIQQHMAVNDDVVADIHVVSVEELDELKRLEVLAATLEDSLSEQPPKLHAEGDVLPAERCAVERIPEPEKRLHRLEERVIAVRVELRLERDVARIERGQCEPGSHRQRLIGDGRLQLAAYSG